MLNVIVIATVHKEKGQCNLENLYKIIKIVKPDVIFEELSAYMFNEIYEGSTLGTMETETIKLYLNDHDVVHHPVDLDQNLFIDRQLKESILKMNEIIYRNPNYQNLRLHLDIMTRDLGFPYLNSIECELLFAQIYFFEQRFVETYNDRELEPIHKKWIWINDRREQEMIENIYKYSKSNKFKNAIFLVGAEHRKPIIDRVNKILPEIKTSINWNFNFFES